MTATETVVDKVEDALNAAEKPRKLPFAAAPHHTYQSVTERRY